MLTAPIRNYDNDTPTTARDKFGNQKGISSDMYFERNAYDPQANAEAKTRLQAFQGATSISSSAYFERDEEEELAASGRGGGAGGGGGAGEGLLGDGTLAGLEVAARDMAGRIMSNPDVQNAAENIRAGAMKVRFPLFCLEGPTLKPFLHSCLSTWRRCRNADELDNLLGGHSSSLL